ncbi:MAG: DUF5916 domain-containing protein [Pseudomonadota bacterium]
MSRGSGRRSGICGRQLTSTDAPAGVAAAAARRWQGTWRARYLRSLLWLSIACCPATYAGTAVFGTFESDLNAERQGARVARLLGVTPDLYPTRLQGRTLVRLLGPRGMSPDDARALAARARALGIEGAWFLAADPRDLADTLRPMPAPAEQPLGTELAATPEPAEPEPAPAEPSPIEPSPAPVVISTRGAAGEPILIPEEPLAAASFQLNGQLNEAVWERAARFSTFTVIEPDTLVAPDHETEVRLFYTKDALYVGMRAEQPLQTQSQRLSGRDDFFNRDSFSITLDTSGEGLYGYWFSVALGGSLADGKVAPERQFTREWDGPWDGRTHREDDAWYAEMRLPWSMMAMPRSTESVRSIGVYASRQLGYRDERHAFPALPSTGARFMSALQPTELPGVKPRQQLDVYPYASSTFDAQREDVDGRAGADVFWRPSTNVQVSATITPDFGSVEADDVVINLTATEAFFPERRLFFLEGNEIFNTTPRTRPQSQGGRLTGSRRTPSLFTGEPTQLLNTRRIGGAANIVVPTDVTVAGFEQSTPTELIGALKVTGQAGPMRYGFLGAAEDDPVWRGETATGEEVRVEGDGRNFGVGRVLLERAVNGRQSIGYMGTIADTPFFDAYVHGVDAHYLSPNGRFSTDIQYVASDKLGEVGHGALINFDYTPRRGVQHQVRLDALDSNLDISDLGFLRRNDFYGGTYQYAVTKTQGLRMLRSRRSSVFLTYWQNADGQAVRTGGFLRNSFTFKNYFELRTEVDYFPRRWEDLESNGNGAYRLDDRWVFDVAFGTNTTRALAFSGRIGARNEELGDWTYTTALGFTYKPNDRFSLDLDLNYRRRHGWVLSRGGQDFTTYDAHDFQPRLAMDLFFSARQQLRLTMQWAAIKASDDEYLRVPLDDGDLFTRATPAGSESFVINRMTAQLRYRWQIAPLSDLFVVYTRGSNVANDISDEYGELFTDALTNPVIDVFVVKLRYRFGR